MLSLDDDKALWRQAARTTRDALSSAERAEKSTRIAAQLRRLIQSQPQWRRIAVYMAMGSEVDIGSLVAFCTQTHRQAFAPRILPEGQGLCFVPVDAQSKYTKAKGGFVQPLGEGVLCASLDVVLVPGLLFDDRGYRLGWGGGHYDQALFKAPVCAVGVCFAVQRAAQVPIQAHDVSLDAIVDETGVTQCAMRAP